MNTTVSSEEVVEYLRLTGAYTQVYRDLTMRKLVADAARKNGMNISDDELQQAADGFRARYRLSSAKDTHLWLKVSGLSVEQFEKYLETNMLVEKWKDKLRDQADTTAYVNRSPTAGMVRDLVFQDWVKKELSKA